MEPQDDIQREALGYLRLAYGPKADFRPGQWEAVRAILKPSARVLLVQSTGWGKSVVYFLAARLLRERKRGMTLVVSPLIALMRNQVEFAARFGLRAAALHSENRECWSDIEGRVAKGEIDVLLVSPERLHMPEFQARVRSDLLPQVALAVIDEAHCISEWGHDFRPEYRTILRELEGLPASAAILGATATATDRVEEDLHRVFGPFLDVQRGALVRPSLRLVAVNLADPAERLAWLARYLPKLPGSGIVYALTVFDAKEVARWLRSQGIAVEAYHSELEGARRVELESEFTANRLKALVATTALGMGYDKADIGFVVHYQLPASLIAYYQQIGRAGRAMDRAYAVLLAGAGDEKAIWESFLHTARPPTMLFEGAVEALVARPLGFAELAERLGAAPSQVRRVLDILDSADALIERGGVYSVREAEAREEIRHGDEVRTVRRAEYCELLDYVASDRCRMQAVTQALGEPAPAPCGICDRCRPTPPPHLEPSLVGAARTFLEGEIKILLPRFQLPAAVSGRSRKLGADEVNEPGIVLGFYGDDHWGKQVREGKYADGHYGEALLEAAAQAVESRAKNIGWVAWIPSTRPDSPLAEFARRLAERLQIPAVDAVRRVKAKPPQKTMEGPAEPFWNVWDAFRIAGARPEPCLLVDDVVDSGWTLTIVGMRLRQAGCRSVVPLALAAAKTGRIRLPDEPEEATR